MTIDSLIQENNVMKKRRLGCGTACCWLTAACFLFCFGFNRGRKAVLGPLVYLARKDFQVLKACLDHRDPRYVTLQAWFILYLPKPFSCPPHRSLRP